MLINQLINHNVMANESPLMVLNKLGITISFCLFIRHHRLLRTDLQREFGEFGHVTARRGGGAQPVQRDHMGRMGNRRKKWCFLLVDQPTGDGQLMFSINQVMINRHGIF